MSKKDNIILIQELKEKNKQINIQKSFTLVNEDLKRMAQELFSQALFMSDKNNAYNKAIEAYEIFPSEYQYKTFAISKLSSVDEKEYEFKNLIDEIEKNIMNSLEGLFEFYDYDEIYSQRFKELKYKYIITLIINKKYQDALKELLSFNERYSYLEFKTKHLVLNLCLALGKKEMFISEYNSISGRENILYLLPFSLLLFKNNQIEASQKEINRINKLNHHLKDIMVKLDDIDVKKEIECCSSRYYMTTKEEVLFSLKYFDEYYNDEEYKKLFFSEKE